MTEPNNGANHDEPMKPYEGEGLGDTGPNDQPNWDEEMRQLRSYMARRVSNPLAPEGSVPAPEPYTDAQVLNAVENTILSVIAFGTSHFELLKVLEEVINNPVTMADRLRAVITPLAQEIITLVQTRIPATHEVGYKHRNFYLGLLSATSASCTASIEEYQDLLRRYRDMTGQE